MTHWFILVGALLLLMGSITTVLKRQPVTTAIIYLMAGVLVGPMGLNLFHFNPLKESALLELMTEVAVLISLFSAGVKMPVPVRYARWRVPLRLASLSMVVSVALIAAFAHWVLGLPPGAAILLGGVLSPTDPVLATDVQSRHPGDGDQLRFALTSEAGMNDGTAFPFVVLGLGLLSVDASAGFWTKWVLVDLAWATVGGIGIGAVAGSALARLGWWLRCEGRHYELLDDFLGLGLIGFVYGVSVLANTWGFLAVFFAAVALRQTELKLARVPASSPRSARSLERADAERPDPETSPTVSGGALVFKEHLERLSELVLVLLLGGTLFHDSWTWSAGALALFLFVVVRPVSVVAGLAGTGTPWRVQALAGWFGVRGIGSLYYLMYAIQHGLAEPLALRLIELTLIVVTLSILIHGVTVKPMLWSFWRRDRRGTAAR